MFTLQLCNLVARLSHYYTCMTEKFSSIPYLYMKLFHFKVAWSDVCIRRLFADPVTFCLGWAGISSDISRWNVSKMDIFKVLYASMNTYKLPYVHCTHLVEGLVGQSYHIHVFNPLLHPAQNLFTCSQSLLFKAPLSQNYIIDSNHKQTTYVKTCNLI